MPQRIQAQPMGALGGRVAQRIGRQPVARFMDGQTQKNGCQTQSNALQRAKIQRRPQIFQILQWKFLPVERVRKPRRRGKNARFG